LVAKRELQDFAAEINRLELEPELKKGMDDLITYLAKKIDKRISQFTSSNF